jgi:hypothetical protein
MAIYTINNLLTRINQFIKRNLNREITGNILQGILHDIVDSIIDLINQGSSSGIITQLGDGMVYCNTVNISSAQILAGDEVELVPAPGAGISIYPINIAVISSPGTIYAENADNYLKIGTAQNKTYSDLYLGLKEALGSIGYLDHPFEGTQISNYDITNKSLNIDFAPHTAGNITLKIKIYYYKITH